MQFEIPFSSSHNSRNDNHLEAVKDITIKPPDSYTTYGLRWVIVLLQAMNSGMSGAILMTFVAIWMTSVDFFGVDNLGINMFSITYMVFFLPSSLLSVFVTERFGTATSVTIAAVANMTCCWVRVGGSFHPEKPASYAIVLFGQCIAAFGQPFLLNLPPRIANDWFPVNERDIVMHIMTQSNNIGGAIGGLIPAYQVFVDPETYAYSVEDINRMLIWQGITSTGIFILTALLMRSEPPSFPTADVEIQKKLRGKIDSAVAARQVVRMLQDWITSLRNPNFCVLLASFSCIVGVSWAFLAVVGQMVYPCSYDAVQTGWALFSLGFAGVFGSLCIAFVLRYKHNYLWMTKGTVFLAAASGIWCLGVNVPGNFPVLVAAWTMFGITSGPLIPVVLEFATEMTFPVPGDHSAALLFTGVNWVCLSLTLGLSPLLGYEASTSCSDIINPASGLVLAFLILGAILSLFLYKQYYRLESVELAKVEEGHAIEK